MPSPYFKVVFNTVALLAVSWLVSSLAYAQPVTSAYTKLDFENGCEWEKPVDEIDEQMGGRAICAGYGIFPVLFAEGDLRQFVHYGPVGETGKLQHGFAQWNRVHDTIEWRLSDGRPFATIHRWFIENIDPATGSTRPELVGQVLRISTVGDPGQPPEQRTSCTVGYVDAKANPDANVIARQVADQVVPGFRCGTDRPTFYGERGSLSGSPVDIME